MNERPYDVAVLGGGPGGYVAALRAAGRGARTCCIEAGRLGGTCLNVGCIPTKAMLHASELCWDIRGAAQLGLRCQAPAVDGPAFMARTRQVTANLAKGVQGLLTGRGVDIIRGRGRLANGGSIEVTADAGSRIIAARSIIIATGSRPSRPGFLPAHPRVMTTDEATLAPALPSSVIIVGGGVIGCEFATIYSELGIATTVVEVLDRLCPTLDPEVSAALSKSLQRRGVNILAGARISRVDAGDAGVKATLEDGRTLAAESLLAAVGRKPNVEDVGLEQVGIRMDQGIIRVDERCQTNLANIYAVGDVAETRQYAHLASRMGVIAADNATGHSAADSRTVVPTGVYTHPEAATVGLSEEQARQQGRRFRVSRFPYSASGMAQAYGQGDGLVKLIAEERGGLLLGALVIGPHATDVIQEAALALRQGLTVSHLENTIHGHPTFVEGLAEAAGAWLNLPTHIRG